ncbi:MAG: hydroxymethylglutaryl-CoA synthase family protein [Myxococcales bacterium]|nr:hydroxymethylglutaryl-CoA synthase family protein [Myxococcales bacterium]
MPVGIEKIWAYPCTLSVDFEELAAVRGHEPGYPSNTLLARERSLNPCWEDPTTMAVNAALPMLDDEDRERIELLVVGTESSPDQGKPYSTFVHHFLGLQSNCRNFETKHACYGGTAALTTALHWVASGVAPGAKALVICSDQSRSHLGLLSEYVMGAGAIAMLVSDDPKVLEIDIKSSGYWTQEVGDTFRPTSKEEAGNTENSVYCYLEALEGAFDHFQRKATARNGHPYNYDEDFRYHIYHVPFGAMGYRAHRTLLKRDRRVSRAEAEESFEKKVKPSLSYVSRVGGTYTGSTFYSLIGLVDNTDAKPGDPLTFFAYGSGSCCEMYAAKLGPEARERIARVGLAAGLDARKQLSVADYETLERERQSYIDVATYEPPRDLWDGLWQSHYEKQRRLTLRGLKGHFRHYEWSC